MLQSVVYGFGDPISKIAFEVTPVYSMMSVRYSIAFITIFIMFRKRVIHTLRTAPVKTWLFPGLFIGMSYLLNNVALALTDATSVAFLRSLSVIITPAIAFLIYRKHYKWQHILIQVMVLPGMYLLCVRGGLSGFGIGETVAIFAAVLMAATLVLSQRFLSAGAEQYCKDDSKSNFQNQSEISFGAAEAAANPIDPVSLTALQAGCSAALALAGAAFFEGGLHLENTTPAAWAIILYLAILCTSLGYLMQNLALTRISERTVSLLQSLCPVMTAVFSFFLLGETLSPAGIAGAAIIITCVTAGAAIGPSK
ncbi:MAG: DMT family transporter [Mogibacterium sp.]|nr:DMT family transporter [Mogibacterium sp.]